MGVSEREVCGPHCQAGCAPTAAAVSRGVLRAQGLRAVTWTILSPSSVPSSRGETPSPQPLISLTQRRQGHPHRLQDGLWAFLRGHGCACVHRRWGLGPRQSSRWSHRQRPALTDPSLSKHCGLPESISDSGISLMKPFITGRSGKSDRLQGGSRKPLLVPAPLLRSPRPPPPCLQMWPWSRAPLGNPEAELLQCQ